MQIKIGDESWVAKLERREVRVFESKGFSKFFKWGTKSKKPSRG